MARVWTVRLLWLLALALPVRAEMVQGLYAAKVPVADQSQQSLASAARDALGQVVVKVSGSEAALANPVVQQALPEARSHVQQYAYVREQDGLAARFEFETRFVSQLVARAGLPLWTANRPRVLAWVVIERDGIREFVGLDTDPELAAQLLAEFERRGVPAQLPLFDLTDATAIGMEEVWRMDRGAALSASLRYDSDHLLLGRGAVMSDGSWTGDWTFVKASEGSGRGASAPEFPGFARAGVGLAADAMAARYAVATGVAEQATVSLVVTGVQNFADYAALVSWLEGLELVDRATVSSLSGDRLALEIATAATIEDLARLFELNRRLQPVPEAAGLEYLWQN